MKRSLLAVLLMIMMVVSLAGCSSTEAPATEVPEVEALYTAGTYDGEGEGHGGTFKVSVTVDELAITAIDVVENPESEFAQDAVNSLVEAAIAQNSGTIDAVSGASETSAGVIGAISNALAKAYVNGAPVTEATTETETAALEDVTTDVVIVGAGGAGLSAAISAADAGMNVLVLEKMPMVGGNTNYATGGLNAAVTAQQAEKGIEDSVELFVADTMKGGKELNNPALVQVLAENSADTVAWLTEMGADLTDIGRLGGASLNRAHRPTGGAPVGNHLVQTLKAAAESRESVSIATNNKVVAILTEDGAVTGVTVETAEGTYNVYAKAVILASGGFGNNQEIIVQYQPSLEGFGTTNQPGATGDAVVLVAPLNVSMIDMEYIQTHPTVVPEKNKMITEAVRGNGAILVNRNGERFINEITTRDVVSAAELEQEGKTSFLVFDQGVRESLSAIEKYINAGLVTEAATVEDLAAALGVDTATLATTIETYNGYVADGVDPDFDRPDMPRDLATAPYYYVEVGPAVHHTMGGIEINTTTEVINQDGNVIAGLFAAGEVTGGVHGANRLGGNALSDITTFGRIAGESAAAFATAK